MAWPADLGKATRVLAIGECMVELRHRSSSELELAFAGDTYNAAVYLTRMAANLGVHVDVGYLSGLGDDEYSARMRAAWAAEGISDRSVTLPGRQPGLYAVSTDSSGERSFTYWRSTSAASALFAGVDWIGQMSGDVVHFSGITLQLMSRYSRQAFLNRLAELRRGGATVTFDTNFRPAGWADPTVAREVFAQAAQVSDVVLATFDDEQALTGDETPSQTLDRYTSWGPSEVVVKLGERGALVRADGQSQEVPATPVPNVIDTTAAGDSFAGAYIAGRLAGMTPHDAAGLGAEMAALVIQHPGAIMQRTMRSAR